MHFLKNTTLLLTAVLISCQETKDTADTTNNDSGVTQTQSCTELTAEECSSNSNCAAISATQVSIDETIECYEQEETSIVGCQDADVDCATEQTFASSGDGNCLYFPNTCIPEGWSTCPSLSTFQDCSEVRVCAELEPNICDNRDDCVVISASDLTLDSTAECYTAGEVEPVGCMNAGTGCTGAITFAGASESLDECMMFYNGCIPEGWVPCDALNGYATCEE